MLESNSSIWKLQADQFFWSSPRPIDMQMVNVLQATCYMLHATCYMLHADHFSPCPVNMQMVDVLNAICYMLHAKCYMLKTKSWSDLLILTSSSQHADGRCVARPRTSLGLVSHQPPCWQHSFRLFTQFKKHRPELVLSLFCSYNWENTKMTRQTDYLPGRVEPKIENNTWRPPSFNIQLHDNRRRKFSQAGEVPLKPEIHIWVLFFKNGIFIMMLWPLLSNSLPNSTSLSCIMFLTS